jgi:hypothetical protein
MELTPEQFADFTRRELESLRILVPDAEQVTDDLCRELEASRVFPRETIRSGREGYKFYSRTLRQFIGVSLSVFPH